VTQAGPVRQAQVATQVAELEQTCARLLDEVEALKKERLGERTQAL
jgi:hypothetical protein